MASRRPVTTALQSFSVFGFLTILSKIYSVTVVVRMHSAMTINAWKPYRMIPKTVAGIRAMTTFCITLPTVRSCLK